ncbi:MAG: glycosyltransferase [Phycisphaera sp.]|nr:MAG: glycosyltransferase [Phycisphaera sp.]
MSKSILLVNWAPIWKGAHVGGGVNGYLHHLGPALCALGHEVTYVFGGLLYTDQPKGCFSRRHDDFHGIRVIEIINSPVLAPSASQFREPMAEVHAPELVGEFSRLLRLIKPDLVHWHNIEGFSIDCVDACREFGAKIVYSLHNYHTLCSQVTLCKGNQKPCLDFRAGHDCSTCIQAPDPYSEKARRIERYANDQDDTLERLRSGLQKGVSKLKHELSWPKRIISETLNIYKHLQAIKQEEAKPRILHAPGSPTTTGEDLAIHPLRNRSDWSLSLPVLSAEQIDHEYEQQAGKPLDNIPKRDPSSGKLFGVHARRRSEMVSMLNRCDRVLAVSDFVRLKYETEGVEPERISTMRIGTSLADIRPPRQTERTQTEPVRIVFVGYNHFNKGLPLLLAAMQGMRGDDLRQIGLSVYAPGVQTIGPEFRRLYPPLAELNIRDSYEPSELEHILTSHDVCYVGSSWWDPLPQTALESLVFRTPVLGAEAGGIPEAVRDGKNGFLFRANDPHSLRLRLLDVIEAKGTSNWPTQFNELKTISSHASELSAFYGALTTPSSNQSILTSRQAESVLGAHQTAQPSCINLEMQHEHL